MISKFAVRETELEVIFTPIVKTLVVKLPLLISDVAPFPPVEVEAELLEPALELLGLLELLDPLELLELVVSSESS